MPRPVSSEMLAALQSPMLYPALFIEANFASGPVYVWSGLGTRAWNGQVWQGFGNLLELSTIEEASTVDAKGITLTVSGIDPNLLAQTLGEYQVGLPVIVYLGLFYGDTATLINTPITSWGGRMDKPTISMGGDAATIQLQCESRLLDLNVPCERRYTQPDQAMDYPGDLGFSFVNSIQNVTIYWGALPQGTNNFSTGSGG